MNFYATKPYGYTTRKNVWFSLARKKDRTQTRCKGGCRQKSLSPPGLEPRHSGFQGHNLILFFNQQS